MPEKIGHYTIVSELGRGGMGIVYKAREESLDRFVAIKVLTEKLTEDDTFLQRFVREARAAAGVTHPNIVQIYFIGEDNAHPYFVMEYVSGQSLNRIVRADGRMGNPRAAQVILQAAHGLAAAHDRGIIHRDIKPANLMLDERGTVKIADFGLALPADAETRLTATGMMVGTPGYLSPEQCRGEKIDSRTDIYALGVTFFELLAGTPPFRGESPLALLRQILDEQAPDIQSLNPDVDAETRRILEKMIAKDRDQRYQSCHEIVADLEEYLAGHGVRSMTSGLAVRKPTAAEAAAIAAAVSGAETQVLGGRGAAQNAATVVDQVTAAAATRIEPVTDPEVPLAGPATAPRGVPLPVATSAVTAAAGPVAASYAPPLPPSAAPYAPQPVTPPVVAMAPRKKSSRAWIVAVLLLILLGGGLAAAFVGMTVYRKYQSAKAALTGEPAADASATTATTSTTVATTSAQGQLLSHENGAPSLEGGGGVTPSAPVTETAGGATTSAAVLAPAATGVIQSGSEPTRQSASVVSRPVQTGRVEPRAAAPAPSSRRLSGVAVAVTGDQALLGAVSGVLNTELSAAGLHVTDAQTLPSTEELVGRASTSRLIDALRSAGMAVLVLAKVEPAGQRELKYMGRYDTAFSARVTLVTYDLATGRPIGENHSATIEYTSATTDRQAEKVVGPMARTVAESLENR